MLQRRSSWVAAAAGWMLAACGTQLGGDPLLGAAQTSAVVVKPAVVQVAPGGSLIFSATVTGVADQGVTWSVAEADGGTVSSGGIFRAPASSGIYHVVAQSKAEGSSGEAIVLVASSSVAPAVEVAPAVISLTPGGSFNFAVAVAGVDDKRVTWSVQEGASAGSVSASGVYTAPSANGTYHVVATSVADPTRSDFSTVAVSDVPVVVVSVSPRSPTLAAGASLAFVASVTGTIDTAVSWSVQEGASGGTVTASGVYTAPSAAGTYHLVATSRADGSKRDSATVTVRTSPPLSLQPSVASAIPGETLQFTTTGGRAPYGYDLPTNGSGGSITSDGLYRAGAAGSTTDVVRVIDSSSPAQVAYTPVSVAAGSKAPTPAPTSATPVPGAVYVSHAGNDSNAGTIGSPWRNISTAVSRMSAGQTLYIRGGTSPDTNTACTGDGAQNGACWTGTFPSSYRGADGNPVTIAAYPGETVIIEPTGSGDIMNLGSPRSSCSNIVFRDLIFDARNRGKARVIKVQPLIWPGGTEDANLCHHISFIGGKIRHGGQTSAIEPYASYFTIDGVEIYENGWHDSLDTCSDGEHDHAIYGGGGNWLIQNSYFHHNIQAIQVWWPALSSPGNWRILNNRFHDNDINPWAEAQFGTGQGTPCPGFGGVIALYDSTGSRCTIQGNQIYNHTRAAYGGARRPQNGVDLGGAWGSPVSGCTVTGNWIYGNSGVQVLVGSGSLGNTTSPNYDHAP